MREPIQGPGQEIAIVIYDAPLPPKYFRLSKKFIRTLFVVAPVTIVLVVLSFLAFGLGTRFDKVQAPSLPMQMSESDSKIAVLEAEVTQLTKSNAELSDKLAEKVPAVGTAAEDPFLMNIKRPYGMQNLQAKNMVNADQFDFSQEPGRLTLKFQIISTDQETKVTGHVLVFMVSESGALAYPSGANISLSDGIKYTSGEPFAVSRVRPTTAVFNHQLLTPVVKFVVYIFSREGDLLLIKETPSYTGVKK